MTTAALVTQQKKIASVRQLLERNQGAIMAALPNHMDASRFLRIALTSIQKTPKLLDCTPESFLGAVIQSAQLGLECDGVQGMAHLIPYGGKVNFQPGFQGLMDLARRSGDISQIIPRVVYQGDTFKYGYGLEKDELHHLPSEAEDHGPVTHVYCIVRLKSGSTQFEVWTTTQIEAHRKRYSKASKAEKDSPWETHWEQMAMKTLIIRALKYAPKSVELQKAIAFAEMAESGIDQKLDTNIPLPSQGLVGTLPTGEVPIGMKMEKPYSQLDEITEQQNKKLDEITEQTKKAAKGRQQQEANLEAETKRKEVRKGLISDDDLKNMQKAALEVGLSSDRLSQILGYEGFASISEVTTEAFPGILKLLKGLKP